MCADSSCIHKCHNKLHVFLVEYYCLVHDCVFSNFQFTLTTIKMCTLHTKNCFAALVGDIIVVHNTPVHSALYRHDAVAKHWSTCVSPLPCPPDVFSFSVESQRRGCLASCYLKFSLTLELCGLEERALAISAKNSWFTIVVVSVFFSKNVYPTKIYIVFNQLQRSIR